MSCKIIRFLCGTCLLITTSQPVSYGEGTVLYHVSVLPDLPGGQICTLPIAINEIGQVTGYGCLPSRWEAFLLSPGTGIIGIGTLPAKRPWSMGRDLNLAGHVVGVSASGAPREAFFWSGETGMIGLGDLPGGRFQSDAGGINDLDQVVGVSISESGGRERFEAFIWDPVNGMRGLGDLPGGPFLSSASAINNRTQVVGLSDGGRALPEAFLWDPVNGMRSIAALPNGHYARIGRTINELGQVVGSTTLGEAYFWDPHEGMTTLGVLPGSDPRTAAWGINDLGQVVGAARRGGDEVDPFIWDRANGMRDLRDLLDASTPPQVRDLRAALSINNAGQIVATHDDRTTGVLLTPFVLGDMNCDQRVDLADTFPFLLALVDYQRYALLYPLCHADWAGDVNQDGRFDGGDIDPFFALLAAD